MRAGAGVVGVVRVGAHLLDRRRRAHQVHRVAERAAHRQHRHDLLGVGCLRHALDAQGDLDDDLGHLVGGLTDRPAAIRGLAPGRPVDRDVGPHAGRLLLAGQAVGGLPGHVAQEDVDLEALLDGLALEQRTVEGVADGADDVDEQVVEHADRG